MLGSANPADEAAAVAKHPAPERHALEDKWGSALDAGFQSIPNVLIQAQSKLKLDSVDIVIILNLNLHWWEKSSLPYPPPALIARRMGVSRRTIERRIFRLQKEGWLKRLSAGSEQGIRKYDLSGLVERLQQAAVKGLNQRERRATWARKNPSGTARTMARRQSLLGHG